MTKSFNNSLKLKPETDDARAPDTLALAMVKLVSVVDACMRILFVCTANSERSPTAEMVFKDVPEWEVKSAGTSPDATVPVTRELVDWADRVIVMESRHMERILEVSRMAFRKTLVLGIEDVYYRCSPTLIGLLIMKMGALFPLDEWISQKFNCN